jgi:hypothetical protein
MQRIDTPTAAQDLFGQGKHGFTDGDIQIGVPTTRLHAAWFNSAQEEIANAIEREGIDLDPQDRTQLSQAIRKAVNTAVTGGDFLTRPEFAAHLAAPDPHSMYATDAEVSALGGRVSAVETALPGKSDVGHTHAAADLGYGGSTGATGWSRDPSGKIHQWGRIQGARGEGSGPNITFPIAFPNACEAVSLTDWNRSGGGTGQWIAIDCFVQITGDPSATGFGTFIQKPGDSDNFWEGCFWEAWGH